MVVTNVDPRYESLRDCQGLLQVLRLPCHKVEAVLVACGLAIGELVPPVDEVVCQADQFISDLEAVGWVR